MKNQTGNLKTEFEKTFRQLAALADKFPWENKAAYAQWLAQTYHFVRYTTVFLTLTAAKFGVRGEEAHKGTLRHLREETGHDKLALNDLKALGVSVQDLPELLQTSALYQTQYYWIECFGPISHAGYALMLEGIAAQQGGSILKRIEAAHGKNAGSFLRVHVHADDDHFDDGIERLSLAPEHDLEGVLGNLKQSAALYQELLTAIVEKTVEKTTEDAEVIELELLNEKKAA